MRKWIIAIGLAATWLGSELTQAQTIQLPTFHYFTVATSVLVPDRGSTYLGGVSRARFGSTSNGVPGLANVPGAGRLFGNRGIGSEVSSSGVHASATIMDLDELDRSVLAEAAAKRGAATTDPAIARKAAFIAKHIARSSPSLSEPETKQTSQSTSLAERKSPVYADPEEEARQVFQIAQQAEAKGHLATARINYKRVALLSRGKLRDEAQSRLDAIKSP